MTSRLRRYTEGLRDDSDDNDGHADQSEAAGFGELQTVSLARTAFLVVATFAMSRYNESGNDIPRMRSIMTARRLVRSQRKDMSANDGNKASITLGIVSPTMTQNATIPPNALYSVRTSF